MIRVHLNDDSDPGDAEGCALCATKTHYWATVRDVPVCFACSLTREEEELPTKATWIAAQDDMPELDAGWTSRADVAALAERKLKVVRARMAAGYPKPMIKRGIRPPRGHTVA